MSDNIWEQLHQLEDEAPSIAGCLTAVEELRVFAQANKTRLKGLERHTVYALAICQMKEDSMLPSSMVGKLRHWTTWRVNPFDTDEARTRIQAKLALTGLERISSKTGVTFIKELYPLRVLQSIAENRSTDELKDRKYRFLWIVALLTGNRMKHVREASHIAFEDIGVSVRWGPRKIRTDSSTVATLYPYEWTGVRVDAELHILNHAWKQTSPLIATPDTVAGCMDAWLRERARKVGLDRNIHLTTGCARVYGVQRIACLVKSQKINSDEYEMLVDQTYKTFLLKYRRGIET